jgi:hypothetical protein
MPTEVIGGLISSLVGGLLVAIVNYLFTRRKTNAETEKLRAEAEKLRAESEKIRNETSKLTSYMAHEQTVYDGGRGIEGYDFLVVKKTKGNHHAFRQGILIIERTQTRGIYHLQLRKYNCGGKELEFLPKNDLIVGKRRLRVAFEARATQGVRTIILAITSFPAENLLDKDEMIVDEQYWNEYNVFFRVPPSEDCLLQIVDLYGSQLGSLQLRHLTLAERLPQSSE